MQIPQVDRRRGDFRNIFMAIIEKTGGDLYKLAKNGKRFQENQFCMFSEKLVDLEGVSPEKKSLRQLADE